MALGGRMSLSRHGQWRPALPSIAEGSVLILGCAASLALGWQQGGFGAGLAWNSPAPAPSLFGAPQPDRGPALSNNYIQSPMHRCHLSARRRAYAPMCSCRTWGPPSCFCTAPCVARAPSRMLLPEERGMQPESRGERRGGDCGESNRRGGDWGERRVGQIRTSDSKSVRERRARLWLCAVRLCYAAAWGVVGREVWLG
uniref:Uncharacterized protein n=1 Tax=Oryza barthii TaxID=65489 RepID=A0A0D3HCM9_9ORYZ